MKNNYALFVFMMIVGLLSNCSQSSKQKTKETPAPPSYALALHGGAGTISKSTMPPEQKAAYLASLDSALSIGNRLLASGANAQDAVTAVIVWLENDSLFNAGRGAVFTHEGKNELDASFMDGKTLQAGAVTGVQTVKNPIKLARKIMEHGQHVMLAGAGAEQFAKEQGLEIVDPKWFFTQRRWQSLQKILETEKQQATGSDRHGTVGCVALDQAGNLAAGTSTGGMTAKRWNRIGDAPVIGAGTYADNKTCAVSCTGHGEYFIRNVVAYQVSARMLFGNASLETAANETIYKVLNTKAGEGGLIAVDRQGNISMPFNSEGMYRGWVTNQGRFVGIWE